MQITTKKRLLLFIYATLLLGSLVQGCEQQSTPIQPISPPSEEAPTLPSIPFSPASTYTHWGFSVSVPSSWLFVETRNPETGGGIIDLFTSGSSFNSMSITASAIEKIGGVPDIAAEAQYQIKRAQELWGNIELLNNQAMEDNWDWFLSFDSTLESTTEEFHTEIYFKITQSNYYILKLSYAAADRYLYPWKEVIETFTIS
jgi:hypothetical protein